MSRLREGGREEKARNFVKRKPRFAKFNAEGGSSKRSDQLGVMHVVAAALVSSCGP